MTVKELIEKLQQMPQDYDVEIASRFNYDDELEEEVSDVFKSDNHRVIIEGK